MIMVPHTLRSIQVAYLFFIIRSMKYSFNLKKVTTKKAYNHWKKITNNYTSLSTMNPKAQQHFWVCILTFLGSLFLGSSGGLIKRREITCGFRAGKSLGQRRKHLKTQNRFLVSENHWETRECSTEEGAGLKEQTIASTDELLPFSVPKLTGLTATGIWKPVSSSLLSSSDPPRQAPQCFTKTPFLQSDKSWDPDQRNPPKPKTPQIKQKEGSHSIWRLDLK